MESLRDDNAASYEERSGERQSGEPYGPPAVGELTDRQLDLQRRLVRESLLVRSA